MKSAVVIPPGEVFPSHHSKKTLQRERQVVPDLSIIIPVHNGAQTLQPCLEALLRAPGPTREIILIDDASQDNSVAIAARLGVSTIRLGVNGGSPAARNEGAKYARAPILVFVDSDVVIHSDALERIGEFFKSHPNYSAVFGSYDSKPTCPNLVSRYRNLLHHFIHQRGKPDAETFWTGLGAVRRSAFRAVCGFRLGKPPGMEDVDFGLRLADAGFRISLERDILGTHLKHWTLQNVIRTDVFDRALPWFHLILTNRRFTNDLNTSMGQRLGVILANLAPLSLVFSYLWPEAGIIGLAMLLLAIAVNFRLIGDFNKQGGLLLAAAVIPLHYVYQLCAGIGAVLAIAIYLRSAASMFFGISHDKLSPKRSAYFRGTFEVGNRPLSQRPAQSAQRART